MIRLYSSHDPLLVGYLRDVLEAEGVACLIKNEHLLGAAGDLPPIECWPELWIIRAEDAGRARRLLESVLPPASGAHGPAEPWECPRCGETLEPQFTDCWRCQGPAGGGLLA